MTVCCPAMDCDGLSTDISYRDKSLWRLLDLPMGGPKRFEDDCPVTTVLRVTGRNYTSN